MAIAANLILLGYFKYANFFVSNLNRFAGSSLSIGEVILPLGISFFTFTQIAFLADPYQGKVKEFNFVHYTLFVTYFPHLIAGPVLHHKEMMPQFAKRSVCDIDWNNVTVGLTLKQLTSIYRIGGIFCCNVAIIRTEDRATHAYCDGVTWRHQCRDDMKTAQPTRYQPSPPPIHTPGHSFVLQARAQGLLLVRVIYIVNPPAVFSLDHIVVQPD